MPPDLKAESCKAQKRPFILNPIEPLDVIESSTIYRLLTASALRFKGIHCQANAACKMLGMVQTGDMLTMPD